MRLVIGIHLIPERRSLAVHRHDEHIGFAVFYQPKNRGSKYVCGLSGFARWAGQPLPHRRKIRGVDMRMAINYVKGSGHQKKLYLQTG